MLATQQKMWALFGVVLTQKWQGGALCPVMMQDSMSRCVGCLSKTSKCQCTWKLRYTMSLKSSSIDGAPKIALDGLGCLFCYLCMVYHAP